MTVASRIDETEEKHNGTTKAKKVQTTQQNRQEEGNRKRYEQSKASYDNKTSKEEQKQTRIRMKMKMKTIGKEVSMYNKMWNQ